MKIDNLIHQKILKEISQMKSVSTPENIAFGQRYIGTDKPYHGFTTKQITDLVKKVFKENQLNSNDLIQLLNSLYQHGASYTEIVLGPMILSLCPQTLKNFDPQNLDLWLNYTHGWAEDDVLCQSIFTAENVLAKWPEWEKILKNFNRDSNVNKRRASLVLLTKSVRQSDDSRLSKLAFKNIENLKWETDILITKAVSWLLRSLTTFHKDEVLKYLEDNKESLPKIAYREALSKALTGRKYNNLKKLTSQNHLAKHH